MDSKIIIEKKKNILSLFITMIICIIGGFITPIGLAPFVNMFKTVGEISSDIISEMKSLDIYTCLGFIIYISIFIGVVGFSKTKASIIDCFYLLGFGLLSLSSVRSLFFFYFIGIFIIARIVTDFIKNYSINVDFFKKSQINFYFYIIIIFVLCLSINNFSQSIFADYVSSKDYPVDAAEYIKKNIDVDSMRLYNHFNFGSYLELCGIPVFIDSRAEIYLSTFNDTNILEDWNISNGSKEYERIFDKYKITHALLYNQSQIVDYISENEKWKKVYQDDNFSIYERVEKK